MEVAFLILLFILGACSGSFLCCQVRRLHLKAQGNKRKSSTSPHRHPQSLGSRSVCLHCHYQLSWYDNIPIFSWLFLRGKCRRCHKPIGIAEFLSELGSALALLALGTTIDITTTNPLTWTSFIFILILVLSLIFLAIYDGLYGELPVSCLIVSIAFAIIVLTLQQTQVILVKGFSWELIWQPLVSVIILGGLYLGLYLISHGKWVGDGDWLLGVALGLVLASPWLALITLFLANLFACLYALPRLKKSQKIYLGPFLVVAFIITLVFTDFFQSMI